jgi:hypothetical protein
MSGDIVTSNLEVKTNSTGERGRRRSERVALQVPLRLSAILPKGRRICVEVQTLVVNAHGGLFDIGMELPAEQRVLLNNYQTSEVVSATIRRVEKSEDGRYAVAFEFQSPSPHFWPISFPPTDWLTPEKG